MTGIHGLD